MNEVNQSEPDLPRPATRLFPIHEDDLEVLEREMPNLCHICESSHNYNGNACLKDALSMMKKIISDVRWGYGPAQELHKVED